MDEQGCFAIGRYGAQRLLQASNYPAMPSNALMQ